MGREGSAVAERRAASEGFPGYEGLPGIVPVGHPPGMQGEAGELSRLLGDGAEALSEILGTATPRLAALLVSERDWGETPRDNEHPYPPGLPYFTRAADPPVLVLPADLSPVFTPRTGATLPLIVWHELAHAFLLQRPIVRTPAWLGELVPQAASAAVARRAGLPLADHISLVDRAPGFTVRGFAGRAGAAEQMAFQNLLLVLGDAAIEEFGDGFLRRLARALWQETEIVDERRAEVLLGEALGPGGRDWLLTRSEFQGD